MCRGPSNLWSPGCKIRYLGFNGSILLKAPQKGKIHVCKNSFVVANLTTFHSSPIASKLRQVWLMRCFVAFLHAPSRSLWMGTSLGRILFDWTAKFTARPFVTGSAKNGFDNGWLFMAYGNAYGTGYGNLW